MVLYIDTSNNKEIILKLEKLDNNIIEKTIDAEYKQAEQLLPAIDGLLNKNNFKISDIKDIKVKEEGKGFTSLRIGVVTANALAYALGVKINGNEMNDIKLNPVEPKYDREPSIS